MTDSHVTAPIMLDDQEVAALRGYLDHARQGAELADVLAPTEETGPAEGGHLLAGAAAALEAEGPASVPPNVVAAAARYWAGRVAELDRELAGEDDFSVAADLRTEYEDAQGHHQALKRMLSA